MKLCKILILFLYFIYNTSAYSKDFITSQSNDESVILGEIITNFFIEYFSDDSIFISIIFPSSKKNDHFMHDFFIELFDDPELTGFAHNTLDRLDDTIREYRHAFNLIIIDNSASLTDILNESTVKEFHLAQRFLIVVIEKLQNVSECLNEMFEILWANGLINSHVLIQDERQYWSLYTFLPYQNGCSTLTSVKQATFTSFNSTHTINVLIDELYPKKLKNFNKCPFYVAASNTNPLVIFHNNSNENPFFDGIEILIIEQIAKIYNFTINYKGLSDKPSGGIIYENGTGSGNLFLVFKREANVTIGGKLLTSSRSKMLSPSYPVMQLSFGFAYKEDNRLNFSLTKLTAPFRFNLWLTLLLLFLSTTFLILLTKKLTRKWRHFYIGGRVNRSPILNIWTTALGKAIANPCITSGRNHGTFARTLLMFWILMWFVIRSCYEGALFNKFQNNQIESPFDTVDKVRASDCNILASSTAYTHLEHLLARDRFVERDLESVALLHYYYDHYDDINGVVVMKDLSYQYFNLMNSPYRRVSFTKDRLYMYTIVYYFPKRSPFKDIFNEKFHEIRDAGLLSHYIKNYEDHQSNQYQSSYLKFRIDSMFAALEICAIMYLISFIVFILEVISVRYHRIKRILDYLTY